jgi:hypothetical protein
MLWNSNILNIILVATPDFIWWIAVKIQAHEKYPIKSASGYMFKVYMKYKWISYLGLGQIPRISLCTCKYSKIQNLKLFCSQSFRIKDAYPVLFK